MWWSSLALAAPVDELPNPRPAGWVSDEADLVPSDAEAALNARIDALHRDLDAEIAVVVVPTVGTNAPGEFATTLRSAWGIGDAQAGNGVVMLVVEDQRRVEVRTGDGLVQLLNDGWIAALQDRLAPTLAAGDVASGVEAGVTEIEAQLREHPDQARYGARHDGLDQALLTTRAHEVAVQQAIDTLKLTGVLGVCIGLGVGAAGAGVAYVRRRERTCPTCGVVMPMLSEEEDDLHLTPGQVVEERIGSVDYQVHQCPKCGQTRTFVVHQFWTSYNPCPNCNNRTREIARTTVVPATVEAPGVDRVDERCVHCDYQAHYDRKTPPLPPG